MMNGRKNRSTSRCCGPQAKGSTSRRTKKGEA